MEQVYEGLIISGVVVDHLLSKRFILGDVGLADLHVGTVEIWAEVGMKGVLEIGGVVGEGDEWRRGEGVQGGSCYDADLLGC